MGVKYSTVSISNYNASPPPDDGSQVSANKVDWSKVKTKIGDPINTAVTSINSSLVAHFDQGPTLKTGAYTTVAADYNSVLEVTGTTTITLLAAATGGAGYHVTIKNSGSAVVTVASSDSIDGSASVTIAASDSAQFMVDAGGTTYHSLPGDTGPSYGFWETVSDTTLSTDTEVEWTVEDGYIYNAIGWQVTRSASSFALWLEKTGGSYVTTGGYGYGFHYINSIAGGSSSADEGFFHRTNTDSFNFDLTIHGAGSSSFRTAYYCRSYSDAISPTIAHGRRTASTAATNLKILLSAGATMNTGRILVRKQKELI